MPFAYYFFRSADLDFFLLPCQEHRREWKQSQKHWRKLRRRGVKLS